jgi:hypothetical protein
MQSLNQNYVLDEDIQSISYRIVTIIIRNKFVHIIDGFCSFFFKDVSLVMIMRH